MNAKNYGVTISDKHILKAGKDCTASGQAIDMLAMAIGEWTEEDMRDANIDYDHESFDCIYKDFNFETALIEHGIAMGKIGNAGGFIQEVLNWAGGLDEAENKNACCEHEQGHDLFLAYDKQELHAGAWLAIEYPRTWASALKEYQEKCEELRNEYNDGELERIAPYLAKQLDEAVNDFWERMQKEWLHGDYSDWAGILKMAARALHADSVEWIGEDNELYIVWNDDGAREFLGDDVKPSKAALLRYLRDYIASGMQGEANKEKAEREKRKAERERVSAYQAERKTAAENERIEKLKAMKK